MYKDGYKSDQETGMDVYCWKSNSQCSILLGIHSSADMEMPKRTGGLGRKPYVAKNLLHTVDQNLLPSVNHNYSMRSNKVMDFCKLIQKRKFRKRLLAYWAINSILDFQDFSDQAGFVEVYYSYFFYVVKVNGVIGGSWKSSSDVCVSVILFFCSWFWC